MSDKTQFVDRFRSASPYIRAHRGRTFVIYVNDETLHSGDFGPLARDLALLSSLGVSIVLTFGARATIEKALRARRVKARYHDNIRVTDARAMGVIKEANGRLLLEIQAGLSMGTGNIARSARAVRVNTGNYVSARPLGIIGGTDYQLTGRTRHVAAEFMRDKLNNGELIVLPPVGYSITGEAYNLSGIALAADVTIALQADKLIYLVAPAELAALTEGRGSGHLQRAEAQELLNRADAARAEGRHYLRHALEVCVNGVERVHLLNRDEDGALLNELFTRDGTGLMLTTSAYDVMRRAAIDDIGGILALIEPYEKQGNLVKRSREKLELEVEHFTVLERDRLVIGCMGLYPYPQEGMGEIACLVVHPDYQGGGCGQQLIAEAEQVAQRQGLDSLFVLTTQAQHWFLQQGFSATASAGLPIARQDLYNYQRNAEILIKQLRRA